MARTKSKRRTGKGVILVITVMLVLSAMLRLGDGAGGALAEALSQTAAREESAKPHDTGAAPMAMPVAGTPGHPMNRAEIGGLLGALRAREEQVTARERQIELRAKALQVADEEIAKRLAQLEQVEENLRRTLALADGAAENDLARLTAVYENMKPKDAAALFAAMEPDFAAGFLGRMRADAAAAVMAGLPPEAAYSISVILAGRNANAPKS